MVRTLIFCTVALLAICGAVGGAIWFLAPTQPVETTDSGESRVAGGENKILAPLASRPSPLAPTPAFKLPSNIQIRFREVAKEAGIDFQHFDGRTSKEYIMDQTGSGLAWLDYDQDGLMDLFFVQGYPFE